MSADRVNCCIPFCRRTTAHTEFNEWICGKHWPSVRASRRRLYARYKRLRKASGNTRYVGICAALWHALKREAIERAAGI
jgi:hypothetical protein